MKDLREFFVLFLQHLCKSEIISKKQNKNLSSFLQLPQSNSLSCVQPATSHVVFLAFAYMSVSPQAGVLA